MKLEPAMIDEVLLKVCVNLPTKIVQTERTAKKRACMFLRFAEVPPVLSKDSANRAHCKKIVYSVQIFAVQRLIRANYSINWLLHLSISVND